LVSALDMLVTKIVETMVLGKSMVSVFGMVGSASGVTVVKRSRVTPSSNSVSGAIEMTVTVLWLTGGSVKGPDGESPPKGSELLTSRLSSAAGVIVAVLVLNEDERVSAGGIFIGRSDWNMDVPSRATEPPTPKLKVSAVSAVAGIFSDTSLSGLRPCTVTTFVGSSPFDSVLATGLEDVTS
jgi:hypothetical protein